MRIWDPGWKKFGSGIHIPDPQHWSLAYPSGEEGVFYTFKWFPPAFTAPRGGGGWHPVRGTLIPPGLFLTWETCRGGRHAWAPRRRETWAARTRRAPAAAGPGTAGWPPTAGQTHAPPPTHQRSHSRTRFWRQPVMRIRIWIGIRRIRMFFGPPRSVSGSFYPQAKIVRKPWFLYCFVTSFWLFIFEKWCKCTLKK